MENLDCIICHRIDVPGSTEHIIPKWLERLVHEYGPHTFPGEDPQEYLDITIPICERCNARFNRNYENPASATLTSMIKNDGRQVSLTRDMQVQVSRWIVKTILLLNVHQLNDIRWSEYSGWLALRGRPNPIPGTNIWVAYTPDPPPSRQGELVGLPPPLRPPAERLASFMLNDLGIYISFTPGGFDDRPTWPSLLRCWPPQPTTVSWPPAVPLSRYEFVEIGDVMRNG